MILLILEVTKIYKFGLIQSVVFIIYLDENLDPNEYKLIIIGNKSDLASQRKIPF